MVEFPFLEGFFLFVFQGSEAEIVFCMQYRGKITIWQDSGKYSQYLEKYRNISEFQKKMPTQWHSPLWL